MRREHSVGQLLNLLVVAHVGRNLGDTRIARRFDDRCHGLFITIGIAPDEHERCTALGELHSRSLSESGGRAGEDDHPPRKAILLEWLPIIEASPNCVTDSRKTRDYWRFDESVDNVANVHRGCFGSRSPSSTRINPAAARSPMRPNVRRRIGSARPSGPLSFSSAS
ncbi:unannotated protein [freshwater metagenome]|uniref:Unannotated protein n=1 Tax=freshwater metagenome TaxID=449393 RepID=A0A6J6XT85_9ZZZZ